MIYELVDPSEAIRQGDIFRGIPRLSFDPSEMTIIMTDGNPQTINWIDKIKKGESNKSTLTVAKVEQVYGIVATQDCDAERDDTIAFFEVKKFIDVIQKESPPSSPTATWWMKRIMRNARLEEKSFYLPVDDRFGFPERMLADFQSLIYVPSKFLLENTTLLRIGRLNSEADEHFRERLSNYFRRYPYSEWYPLNKDEFEAYKREYKRGDIPPKTWQT